MAPDPHATRPTIALVMIVKDESHIITEAFESVRTRPICLVPLPFPIRGVWCRYAEHLVHSTATTRDVKCSLSISPARRMLIRHRLCETR